MSGMPQQTLGRVLIADDSESNRYVVGTWLRRAGHDVREARSGEEALASLADVVADLVVLDVNLPDMSGYDVCERIKADPRTAAVPVLHLSAMAIGAADRTEGLRRGADAFLVAPVEREVLLASIEALLRGASAQRTAVRLAKRLRQLNEATHALNIARDLETLLATIVREACTLFEVGATVAAILDDRCYIGFAFPGEDAIVEACTPQAVDGIRTSASYGELNRSALAHPDLEKFSPTFLASSLDDSDGQRGVVIVETQAAPMAGEADESTVVLLQYARAARTALRNMRTYDIERRIALFLQQNMLPDALTRIAGIDVAARYVASAEHAHVGGDFYEIFPLGNEHIAFAIGDVVGHSLEAATVMAQLRTGIRSYVLEGHGPAEVLARLDRLLSRFHPEMTATVCCALYERRTGRCEIANAGHLPPFVVRGSDVRVAPFGGPLLGLEAPGAPAHVFTLEPDDLLLLFTDGLVERRGETIDEGIQRLMRVASQPRVSLDDYCDRLLQQAGPPKILDDIAVLAIRRTK